MSGAEDLAIMGLAVRGEPRFPLHAPLFRRAALVLTLLWLVSADLALLLESEDTRCCGSRKCCCAAAATCPKPVTVPRMVKACSCGDHGADATPHRVVKAILPDHARAAVDPGFSLDPLAKPLPEPWLLGPEPRPPREPA
jgi:hypothetical protein